MHRAKRPYWLGSLDRWNLLVVGVLVLLLILLNAKGLRRAPQVAVPALPPPVAGTALLAGQPGLITGTAAPDAQVRVFDGDVPLGETVADASGAWRIAVPALSPGAHTLISQELDANGNVVATSEPLTVTVSEPTSIAGKIPGIKLPAAGLKASEPLTLEGTGTPGTTVQVYDGDQVVGETVVAPDGTWKITLPPLALGAHSLVAKLLGADGKEQSASAPVELTVADGQIVVATAVPSAPIAGKAPEIKRPVAAALKVGEPVTLEGTGEPGTTVTLYDADKVVAETTVAPDGTWTLTVPPLAAGTHSLVAKQVGADGKEQSVSAPVELTVADGQIVVATPAPSVAATAVPVAGAPVIALPAAGLKASEPLTLQGTGIPGSTVTVYDGDEVVGQTTVGADGAWQITLPPPAAGRHSLVAKLLGADGKEQSASAPVELTVADGQIVVATPAAVAGATAVPGAGAPVIALPAAGLKASEPLTLQGTGTPGSTVTVYDGDEVVGQTTVGADGAWQITLPPPAAGRHSLVAKLLGADGKEQSASAPVELTVADGQIVVATPAAVAGATAVPGAGAPVIALPAAGLKASEPLTLQGTGTPGSTVTVYDGDEVVGQTTVGADGAWQITLPPPAAGRHSLVAKLLGADGKEQSASAPVELTVADGQIVVATPAAVAGATAVPGAGAPVIALPAAGLKASEPLTLQGTGTPGSTVTVYDGDEVVGQTTVGADGAWQITLPPPAAGRHSLVAKLLGADGKEQSASAPVELTVADGQIVVATPAAVAGATAVPGAVTAVPTVAAGTAVSPTAAAVAGAATAVATAAAGLPSTIVTPGVSAPEVATPVTATAETGGTMTLESTGTPGTTVRVYNGDKLLGEAIVDAAGKWTMTIPKLAVGVHSLVAKLFGKDGKEQATSQALSVTVPEEPGAVASMLPAIHLPAGGKLLAGAETQLAGTAAPGVLLKLFDGSKLVGDATADANGNWQMKVPPLDAGEHTLTVISYGPGGEVQASSKPLTVIVTEPEPATATAPAAGVTPAAPTEPATTTTPTAGVTPAAPTEPAVQPKIGWPPDGSTVVSARPLMAGQAFSHGVVQIYDGATLLGETIADANGYWSFRPSVALKSGQHALTAVATSADGTATAKSPPVTITVRERAVTIRSLEAGGWRSPDNRHASEWGYAPHGATTLRRTAAPNGKVRLYDGNKVMGEVAVDSDGRWTFRPSAPLAEGEHSITVALLDASGSESGSKATVTITVASGLGTAPTQPGQAINPTPATPGVAAVTPPVVTVSAPRQVASRDVISGTAPPGSQVKVYEGDTLLGGTAAGANGKWRFRLPANLPAGVHEIHAVVVGPKGAPVSESETVTIVVSPPRSLPVTGARWIGDRH